MEKNNNTSKINFTNRELDILQLIAKGFSSKEIAEKLGITFHTVESHRKNMLKKHGVSTTVELVFIATGKGWITYQ